MIIIFRTEKLRRSCNTLAAAQKKWGPEMGKLLMRRLDELHAADVLADIRLLPQARCHELTADLKGRLSVDLKHPHRLLFEPAHDPIPLKADGGLDWTRVTAVRILDVGDTHG